MGAASSADPSGGLPWQLVQSRVKVVAELWQSRHVVPTPPTPSRTWTHNHWSFNRAATLRQLPPHFVQERVASNGQFVPDGIEVEFHENGRLKHFLDIEQGKPKGLELTWDDSCKQLSRQVH